MWPYCRQPLYHSSLPVILNTTILNGIGVSGTLYKDPEWIPDLDNHGEFLKVEFSFLRTLWPWSGHIAIHLLVKEEAFDFKGTAQGTVRVHVASKGKTVSVDVPLKVPIIPIPPRNRRILWDQYHNIGYPSGYFPRDSLKVFPLSFSIGY